MKRQLILINLAIFSFVVAIAADAQNSAVLPVVVQSTHATHLIQQYLQNNPEKIATIEQMQDDIKTKLYGLQKISKTQLAERISAVKPEETVLLNIYPIRSHLLTPEKVKKRSINMALPQPIFIVGDDAISKKWLMRYQTRLTTLHAKGFVVNVDSQESMRSLQQTFPGLPLMAMNGDALAKWLQLAHYPVLISDKLIEQ
ncbi:MAG: integrating conjugative element protein [Coxiellaceae bacterium]|nr:integrating conjugative element protein [Coxiellaceae bacterium]